MPAQVARVLVAIGGSLVALLGLLAAIAHFIHF
jgi:hypothetical protein